MSVLKEPQLSAQPCRHNTGRPSSGPQTLPLTSPQGTCTHSSQSGDDRKRHSVNSEQNMFNMNEIWSPRALTVLNRNVKITTSVLRGPGCQLAFFFTWQLKSVCEHPTTTANEWDKSSRISWLNFCTKKLKSLVWLCFVTVSVHWKCCCAVWLCRLHGVFKAIKTSRHVPELPVEEKEKKNFTGNWTCTRGLFSPDGCLSGGTTCLPGRMFSHCILG